MSKHVGEKCDIMCISSILRQKRGDLTSPMTKAPTPTEMSKGQVTTQTTPQKSSIKQRLGTDLGLSSKRGITPTKTDAN